MPIALFASPIDPAPATFPVLPVPASMWSNSESAGESELEQDALVAVAGLMVFGAEEDQREQAERCHLSRRYLP